MNTQKTPLFALLAITLALAACKSPTDPGPDPGHVHQWGEWKQTTPATCTTAGVETRTCTLDSSHKETRAGAAALGHDWGAWVVKTAPTATKNGEETRACKRDVAHTETQIIPATGIKANPTVTWPAGLTATYGQTLFNIALASYANGGGTSGMFSWASPSDSVGGLGTQSHRMTFTPTNTADYNTLTQNVAITVNKINITAVDLTITGPVKNATPVAVAATDDTNYSCSAVSWNPNDNPFLGGTVYTATVTLTADSNYSLTMLSSVTVNGQNANVSNNTGGAVTLSHTFAATDTRTATNIVIKTQPAKLAYTHGDPLDLTGLAVTLTYDDASTEDVAASGFTAKNITVNPAEGIHLICSTHNGHPVTITYGSLPQLTPGNLTVNKATGANVGTPTVNATTHNSVTVNPVTVSNGQSVEYAINETNAAPSTGWQLGTTFGGLNAVKTYYVFARAAENGNYEHGAPSAGTAITTKQQTENEIVGYWVDDAGELSVGGGQGNIVTVSNGGSVTFTADGAGYSNQSWTLNGNTAGSGASYTFDTAEQDKEVGRNYIIGLRVQKDGKFYFTEITIKVVE